MRRARVTPPLPDQSCAILDTGDQVTRLCRREIGSLQAQGRQVAGATGSEHIVGRGHLGAARAASGIVLNADEARGGITGEERAHGAAGERVQRVRPNLVVTRVFSSPWRTTTASDSPGRVGPEYLARKPAG